jgi:hypothetical protein
MTMLRRKRDRGRRSSAPSITGKEKFLYIPPIPKDPHAIVGWIMLVFAVAVSFLMLILILGGVSLFFISLGSQCGFLAPIVILPIFAIGTVYGAILVLFTRLKLPGYLLFVAGIVVPQYTSGPLLDHLCRSANFLLVTFS